MTVSNLLRQPCNKSKSAIKLIRYKLICCFKLTAFEKSCYYNLFAQQWQLPRLNGRTCHYHKSNDKMAVACLLICIQSMHNDLSPPIFVNVKIIEDNIMKNASCFEIIVSFELFL